MPTPYTTESQAIASPTLDAEIAAAKAADDGSWPVVNGVPIYGRMGAGGVIKGSVESASALQAAIDQNSAIAESNAQKIINSEQSTEILRTRLTTVEETLDDPEFMLYPQWTATNTSHTVSVLVNSIRVSVELKNNGNPAVNPVPLLTSTDAQFQAAFDNWALADQTSAKSHIPEIMHLAHTGSIWNVLNGKNYQLFDASATFAQKATSPIGNPVYREHTQ